jgi:restriction system protein
MATVKHANKNSANELSKTVWMVRAGERGFRFEDFKDKSLVGVDWLEIGDMSAFETRDDFKRGLASVFPNWSAHELGNSVGQLYRFVREMKIGETVITYDTSSRVYLIGSISSGYEYQAGLIEDQPNIRRVSWMGSVPRDALSVSSRNSLGSTLTVFSVPSEAVKEFIAFVQNGNKQNTLTPNENIVRAEVDDLFKDQQLKSLEFIKDKVNALDWEEMQELVGGEMQERRPSQSS